MTSPKPRALMHWRWPAALTVLTLFALALRWYFVTVSMVHTPIRGDARQYYAYALNLVHHGIFSMAPANAAAITPDNYRDPGYPVLLALWMSLFGTGANWYAALLLCQAVLGALTVTLATQLGRSWLPAGWALAAGFLMAIWPHSVVIVSDILSETLFGFLCALAAWVCAGALRRDRPILALLAGIAFGAAALTNAVMLPFGILLAAFLCWRKFALRKLCLALAAGSLLLPGAWALRNAQLPTHSDSSSSLGRAMQNFVQGSDLRYHSAYRLSFFGNASQRIAAQQITRENDKQALLMQEHPFSEMKVIMQRMAAHPLRYAVWYLFEKPYAMWGWGIQIGQGDIYVFPIAYSPFHDSPPWIAAEAICETLNPLLFALMLASLCFVRSRGASEENPDKRSGRAALIAVICLVVFVTAVYSALQSEPRYSIPFRSFEMLLAVTTLAGIHRWHRRRRVREMREPDAPQRIV